MTPSGLSSPRFAARLQLVCSYLLVRHTGESQSRARKALGAHHLRRWVEMHSTRR
jgi:hypothetical protein